MVGVVQLSTPVTLVLASSAVNWDTGQGQTKLK